jgi:hypothetical protein
VLWLCARTPSWDARCGWGRVVGGGGRGPEFPGGEAMCVHGLSLLV